MPKKSAGPRPGQRPDTGKWGVFDYIKGNRYWYVSGYNSKREAQEAFEIWKSEQTRLRQADKITVGEVMKFYLDNHVPHTNTATKRLSIHDRLVPFWASLKVSNVTKAKCQEFCVWMNERREKLKQPPYSNDTLRTYLDHLQAALNYAYDNDKLETAPRKLWKPQKNAPVQEFYTRKEIAMLRREAAKGPAKDYLPLFILIACYTGSRPGSILQLKWSHVDIENEEIDFRFAQTSRNKGYGVSVIPPKLKRELLKHRKRGTPDGYVLHINQKPIKSVKKAFKTCREKCGIEGDIKKLRKTFGSWLKQDRIASSYIAKGLAHSSTIVTDRVYAHLDDSYKKIIKESF